MTTPKTRNRLILYLLVVFIVSLMFVGFINSLNPNYLAYSIEVTYKDGSTKIYEFKPSPFDLLKQQSTIRLSVTDITLKPITKITVKPIMHLEYTGGVQAFTLEGETKIFFDFRSYCDLGYNFD